MPPLKGAEKEAGVFVGIGLGILITLGFYHIATFWGWIIGITCFLFGVIWGIVARRRARQKLEIGEHPES
jgi:uncharacterized membrane protein YhiD involved in acid resistance